MLFAIKMNPVQSIKCGQNVLADRLALRCFFAIKINLAQCIPCGQYVLAERFFRNSGYLVECEILSTFECQFPSKRCFEKSKKPKFP